MTTLAEPICLRCLGSGYVFQAPGLERTEPWTLITPKTRERLADCKVECDACKGTGLPTSDRPMVHFLITVALNLLGTIPYEGMNRVQREKHEQAYQTTWALWQYYHHDCRLTDPIVSEAVQRAIDEGRKFLGWYEYGKEPEENRP